MNAALTLTRLLICSTVTKLTTSLIWWCLKDLPCFCFPSRENIHIICSFLIIKTNLLKTSHYKLISQLFTLQNVVCDLIRSINLYISVRLSLLQLFLIVSLRCIAQTGFGWDLLDHTHTQAPKKSTFSIATHTS